MVEVALLAVAALVGLLTLGVPLPYCFGAGLMVMSIVGGVTMKGNMLWGFQQLGNPVLLAIPLFVLAGTIMSQSGIAASLLKFVNVFVGHIRGGLGVVAAVSCAIIGAISGSGLTGIAAIGPLLIPEMAVARLPPRLRHGADRQLLHPRSSDPAVGDDDRLWLGHRDLDPGLFPVDARAGFVDHDAVLCGQYRHVAEIPAGHGRHAEGFRACTASVVEKRPTTPRRRCSCR